MTVVTSSSLHRIALTGALTVTVEGGGSSGLPGHGRGEDFTPRPPIYSERGIAESDA